MARQTCEGAQRIDIDYLRRRKLLAPGNSGSLKWSRGDQQTGSVSYSIEAWGMRIQYSFKENEWSERTPVNEFIPFGYTRPSKGGQRLWLTCLRCRRRCRCLYGGHYFRCRQCRGFVYQSTQRPWYERALDQAEAIREKLGCNWGCGAFESMPFPDKPPRMRWKTYNRLQAKYDALQRKWKSGAPYVPR